MEQVLSRSLSIYLKYSSQNGITQTAYGWKQHHEKWSVFINKHLYKSSCGTQYYQELNVSGKPTKNQEYDMNNTD